MKRGLIERNAREKIGWYRAREDHISNDRNRLG